MSCEVNDAKSKIKFLNVDIRLRLFIYFVPRRSNKNSLTHGVEEGHSKPTGQVNSTGNLATSSDGESDGVGVTQNRCTDDDDDDDDDDDKGMDKVNAWLRQTSSW